MPELLRLQPIAARSPSFRRLTIRSRTPGAGTAARKPDQEADECDPQQGSKHRTGRAAGALGVGRMPEQPRSDNPTRQPRQKWMTLEKTAAIGGRWHARSKIGLLGGCGATLRFSCCAPLLSQLRTPRLPKLDGRPPYELPARASARAGASAINAQQTSARRMRQFSSVFDISRLSRAGNNPRRSNIGAPAGLQKRRPAHWRPRASESRQCPLLIAAPPQPTLYSFASDPRWAPHQGPAAVSRSLMRRRMNVAIVAVQLAFAARF